MVYFIILDWFDTICVVCFTDVNNNVTKLLNKAKVLDLLLKINESNNRRNIFYVFPDIKSANDAWVEVGEKENNS